MSCEIALYMSPQTHGSDGARQPPQCRTSRPATSPLAERGEPTLQILDKIFDILDADRQTQHAVAYAYGGELLGRQALMRRRRRMGDQAFGVTEIVGNVDDLERIGEAEGFRLAAGDIERHQRTAAGHLPARHA